MEGLLAAATADDADTVATAVMGMIGLQPTLAAIEKKKRIALDVYKRQPPHCMRGRPSWS